MTNAVGQSGHLDRGIGLWSALSTNVLNMVGIGPFLTIPLALAASRAGAPPLQIFGTDYPTSDGTCIRDYIHVNDLAEAHVLALGRLGRGDESFAVNLGTGQGCSVLEIVRAVENVTGRGVNRVIAPRRPGDPPALVADPTRAQRLLPWKATRSLYDIVETAWNWSERSRART